MVEYNSIEGSSIETSNLNNQQFRLNKINEKLLLRLKKEKYIASFDYFDNALVVLSATSDSIYFALFATLIGTPVGIASESLSLTFSLSTVLVKKLSKTAKK